MDQPDSSPEQWIEDHADALYRYALSLVREPSLAEDLVQETLLVGWRSADRFRWQSSPRSWLSGILRHKAMDHFRQVFRRETQLPVLESESPLEELFDHTGHWRPLTTWPADPHQVLESAQFRAVLTECLDRLDERKRTAITLRAFEELSTEEICKELGVSTTNLWVLAHRGRESLRRCLDEKWFKRT